MPKIWRIVTKEPPTCYIYTEKLYHYRGLYNHYLKIFYKTIVHLAYWLCLPNTVWPESLVKFYTVNIIYEENWTRLLWHPIHTYNKERAYVIFETRSWRHSNFVFLILLERTAIELIFIKKKKTYIFCLSVCLIPECLFPYL